MDTIQHSGKKGMKWGVRKSIATAQRNSSIRKESTKRASSWADSYTKRASMSNSQLKEKVNRLRLENEFGRLATEAKVTNPNARKNIASVINSVAKMATNKSAAGLLVDVASNALKKRKQ